VIRLVLLFFLIGLPIAEIAVFIMVGSVIGALPTIAIIIVTALIGAGLLKRQGVSALTRVRADVENNKVPAGSVAEAFTVALAGIMLLTPGFITDAFGFVLFVPGVRRWLGQRIVGAVRVDRASFTQGSSGNWPPERRQGPRTIDLDEGEFSRADPNSPWHDRPSGQ